jgi:hypothetical protein
MAERVFKQLEEQLSCSICLDTYTDPKLLQCFHVYCRTCLVPLVDRDQQGKLGLTCPTCRQVTPIPGKGVAGLQSAFHINNLLELRGAFQSVEDPSVENSSATVTGSVATPAKKASLVYCSLHEGRGLELYCETCSELICARCALKGNAHHDHSYEELEQASKKRKKEITASLKSMEEQVTTVTKALARLDSRCGEIIDQRSTAADNIHATFRRLRDVLKVRETKLIKQLDEMTQSKLESLAVQKSQIETTLARLNSCLHFMSESLRCNEEDLFAMKTNTVSQVSELTMPFDSAFLEPCSSLPLPLPLPLLPLPPPPAPLPLLPLHC